MESRLNRRAFCVLESLTSLKWAVRFRVRVFQLLHAENQHAERLAIDWY